jgi:hypothetical protein
METFFSFFVCVAASRTEIRIYSVFQGFSKAKYANGGMILSWSQFLILPQLPRKIKLASKVVKYGQN